MKILKNKKFQTILFNIVSFLIIYFILGFRFENMDDVLNSRIIQNGYLNYFSFQWTNKICYFFTNIFPNFSIWGLFLIITTFLSSIFLTYKFLQTENKKLKIIQLLSLTIILIDLLFQCQWTKVATFSLTTGMLYFLDFFKFKRKSYIPISLLLIFLGISIRYSSIYIVFPFAGIYLLLNSKNKKEFFIKTFCLFLVLATSFSFNQLEKKNYSSEMKYYIEYTNVRSSILDKLKTDFTNIKDLQPEISENDFYIIDNWQLLDSDYFTLDRLKEIKNTYEENTNISMIELTIDFIKNSFRNIFYPLGIILLLVIFLFKRKENILYLVGVLLFIGLFTYMNRLPYRIEFSVLLTSTIFLLNEKYNNLDISHFYKILFTILLIFSLGLHFIFPVLSINSNIPKEINQINKIMTENEDEIYLYTFGTQFREYLDYEILDNKINNKPPNVISASSDLEHPY